MRYVAHVHIIDLMDQVVIYAEVLGGEDPSSVLAPELKLSTQFHGTGETDTREWLRDALMYLVEVV